MSNVKVVARPGIKLRSIAAFNTKVVIEPPPPPETVPQYHFREFWYTGAEEVFTVPDDIFGLMTWQLDGGHGGYYGSVSHGLGRRLNLTQTPPGSGTDIEVRVAGKGGSTISHVSSFGAGAAGYNGGGLGGDSGSVRHGGGGGGATDLRIGGSALTDRVASAPGGGGASNGGAGGNGGYPNGANGGSSHTPATGGTQTAGGTGGLGSFGVNGGTNGTLGVGGNGGHQAFDPGGGGGGGGGFYGGGGGNGNFGGNPSGGGGGGSALIGTGMTLVSHLDSPRGEDENGFATVQFYLNRIVDVGIPPDDTFSFRRFLYTGDVIAWQVPGGIYWVKFLLAGGNGANGAHTGGTGAGGPGGKGDLLECWLPVVPGEIFEFRIGGNGNGPTFIASPPHFAAGAAAYNGGGATGSDNSSALGGGGGGATDVRRGGHTLSDRILVAGGGGGGGPEDATLSSYGGNGGLPNGANGGGGNGGDPGIGGTQTTGYALGIGESGDASGDPGAGGGYYGGTSRASGGGGSSYVDSSTQDVTSTPRSDTGLAFIELRW